MMPSSIKYFHVVLPLGSSIAFQRFVSFVALFVWLCLLLSLTTIIWNHLVRILQPIFTIKYYFIFADWANARPESMTMKWCARLTLVRCLRTFHLMRKYKFVLTNCMPSPIHQHCPAQSWKSFWSLQQRRAILYLMAKTMTKLIVDMVSLGPVLANIFMCHFEEKWVLHDNACPSLWFTFDTLRIPLSQLDGKNAATQYNLQALSLTTVMIFWTGGKANRGIQLPQSSKRK